MRSCTSTFWGVVLVLFFGGTTSGDQILLSIRGAGPDGLAIADVDLTAASAWRKTGPIHPHDLRLIDADGKTLESQFIPAPDFDPSKCIRGKLIVRGVKTGEALLRLQITPTPPPEDNKPFDGRVTTPFAQVMHTPAQQGGLPSSILFTKTNKEFKTIRWGDRLYDRQRGSWQLAADAKASVRRISTGPICTVVRVKADYEQGGKQPESHPAATYDWHYFHDKPLVLVTAAIQQDAPLSWSETHFLELTTPEKDFLHWAGGEPLKQGEFTGTVKTFGFPLWGALIDGTNAVGVFQAGQVLFYDHIKGHGTYMQAHGDAAWHGWNDTTLARSAWLWIGSTDRPVDVIRQAAKDNGSQAQATVQLESINSAIAEARKQTQSPEARISTWWRASAAQLLQEQGQFNEALQAASGKPPVNWTIATAGELGMILDRTSDGLRLLALHDITADRRLSAASALPLFKLTLRNTENKEPLVLSADSGWEAINVTSSPSSLQILWRQPKDQRFQSLEVSAKAELDPQSSAIRWSLAAEKLPPPWSLWQATFPQLAAAELGTGTKTLFPRGSGEVQSDVGPRGFRYGGRYPGGWTGLALMATYAADQKTGLYLAMHDPLGSTKEITVQGRPADRSTLFGFEHPVPGMGTPGNSFKLSGQGVWRLFRGDWFDAALIYRAWMRREARWFPKLGPDGRPDTPLWMRELPVWVMTGGGPEQVEKPVSEFAGKVGLPVGFHWYSWHQIPFDNDYPHYFPTKPGFAEAAARLQKANVHVMPYINGRLWDTHDKGTEDFEFTKIARPAATKDDKGEPYLERYGSKETDGTRVALAVMCPTTRLWQDTVAGIVGRLFGECGTHGVYVDQVAAAQPTLCFDKTHGHPLGGGSWWTQGYWTMFDRIRRDKPADRMLTTECNAEPFINCFDGYLTWHWQYDGQVPAFPAIYGGAIQMFGRAYRGGPAKDLALRMKAGQQLVFGEQIGWFDPRVIADKRSADFLLPLLKLRWELRRYFYAGEMARPPKLIGPMPRITADWQWSGEWPVTTDAVLTGAWHRPNEKKLVLLFVNVSAEPVTTRAQFDATPYGYTSPTLRITPRTADGPGEPFDSSPRIFRELTLPPGQVIAWEF